MNINNVDELKKSIIQYNKTKDKNDFENLVQILAKKRLNVSVAVENLKNNGNASAELRKNAEFCGVFMRTKHDLKSYIVAFTDDTEINKGENVCTLSLGMKECCEMFENTDADGIIINPFSEDAVLLLPKKLILNDMLPAVRQLAAVTGAQTGADDAQMIYQGNRVFQFNILPVVFFSNTDKFINDIKKNKDGFIKQNLIFSQLMACNKQYEKDGLKDEKLKKAYTDRILAERNESFDPDLYFFSVVSEEPPKMYMLDFPPQMQVPLLCKRMYFLVGENGKKAVFLIEISYSGKQFLCEIKENRVHNNYGELESDSVFEETKRVLEIFAKNSKL